MKFFLNLKDFELLFGSIAFGTILYVFVKFLFDQTKLILSHYE